jgi:hypothetical protein
MRYVVGNSKRAASPVIFLVSLGLIVSGCGSDDPLQPNLEPIIANWVLEQDGFRSATLTADIHDPDGEVKSILVDWGDGKNETVEVASSISCTHTFGDKPETYTVAITVTDDEGLTVQQTKSVEIKLPPERCVGFKGIANFCAQFTDSFSVLRIWVEMLGEEVEVCSLGTGSNSCTLNNIPVATQRTKFQWNPTTNSLTIIVQQNTILFGWEEIWRETIHF